MRISKEVDYLSDKIMQSLTLGDKEEDFTLDQIYAALNNVRNFISYKMVSADIKDNILTNFRKHKNMEGK